MSTRRSWLLLVSTSSPMVRGRSVSRAKYLISCCLQIGNLRKELVGRTLLDVHQALLALAGIDQQSDGQGQVGLASKILDILLLADRKPAKRIGRPHASRCPPGAPGSCWYRPAVRWSGAGRSREQNT